MVGPQPDSANPTTFLPPGAGGRVARVVETFLTEVGILLFVFPVLDEYVQYGQKGVTVKLIASSISASLSCFGAAGLTAERED